MAAPSEVGKTLRVLETAFGRGGFARDTSAPTPVVSRPRPRPRVATATALTSLQSSAVTDQTVTLIATVTSSSPAVPPDGSLTFESGGTPIPGCQNDAVAPAGQSVSVTCQTTFAASVEQLTAGFTPPLNSVLAASMSSPESLAVGPDPTTTTVAVARRVVHVHRAVTYTATVQPSYVGPLTPTQVVGFFDNGQPVPSCGARPLVWTGAGAVATCTVSYSHPGQHRITARYVGDANFMGSTSSPARQVDGVKGTIHPTLSWTFYYTPDYTKVVALVVRDAPPGSRVRMTCSGCPKGSREATLYAPARSAARVNVTPFFHGHRLPPGTLVVISVQRPGWVGKRYAFRVRAARPPRLGITCQAPGLAPGLGC